MRQGDVQKAVDVFLKFDEREGMKEDGFVKLVRTLLTQSRKVDGVAFRYLNTYVEKKYPHLALPINN